MTVTAGAIVHGEMVRLRRADGERAHQRRRLRHQPADRPVEMSEAEQLKRQFVAIGCVASDIAAPHQALEHPILFVRRAAERLGDLRLAQPFFFARKQLQNVEALVERRSAVAVEFVGIRSSRMAPQIDRRRSRGRIVDTMESI